MRIEVDIEDLFQNWERDEGVEVFFCYKLLEFLANFIENECVGVWVNFRRSKELFLLPARFYFKLHFFLPSAGVLEEEGGDINFSDHRFRSIQYLGTEHRRLSWKLPKWLLALSFKSGVFAFSTALYLFPPALIGVVAFRVVRNIEVLVVIYFVPQSSDF